MGNLARRLKIKESVKESEKKGEKTSKKTNDKKDKISLDQEMIDVIVEVEHAEVEYATAKREFEEAIFSIKEKFKITELANKVEKIEEKKGEIAKLLFEHIRHGGKSDFRISEKLGRKTPKYKDICEEYVKELNTLVKDPKWYTQKKTAILLNQRDEEIAEE